MLRAGLLIYLQKHQLDQDVPSAIFVAGVRGPTIGPLIGTRGNIPLAPEI